MSGAIDDVRMYSRQLSVNEIQSLYKAGGGSVAVTSPTNTNFTGINSGLVGFPGGEQIGDRTDKIADEMLKAQETLREYAAANENVSKRIEQTWAETAQGVLSSLQSLSSGIRSGGILDILSASLSIFTQLGSVGVFGQSIQTNLTKVPGRAVGGPVSAGMPYLVGEHGPELIIPQTAGKVIPNNTLRSPSIPSMTGSGRAQQVIVHVVANDYFDAKVAQGAAAVAAPIGMRAAAAGSSDAQATIARGRKNRIPGR